MATATAVFCGEAKLNGSCAELKTIFRPPSNIYGRSCYLKVTNVCCMQAGTLGENVQLDEFNVYFLTCDLPQPYSFASINDQSSAVPGSLINQMTRNRVISTFMTGGAFEPDAGHWVFAPSEGQVNGPTRILVEIPNGPQEITFQVWKANELMTDSLRVLAITCEITPIDTGVVPDIPI